MASQVQDPGPGKRPRVHPLLWILIATGVLGLAAWIFVGWINFSVLESYRVKHEEAVCRSLLAIADAQEFVRAGTGAYWRKDVAGLADLPLIEPEMAGADDTLRRQTWLGLWFRPLLFDGERTPGPDRFAVLAFPADPRSGAMYAITRDRTIWRKRAVAGGVDLFPADPAAEGWERTP